MTARTKLASRPTGRPDAGVALATHREALRQRDDTIDMLNESLIDLERSMSDPGWVRLTAVAERQFSPEGMRQIRAACRIFNIANALIKRGLNLRSAYVWAQGVEITARANGKERGEQDVQAVVNDFLTDPGNVRTVTGPEARDQLEHALGTDGNVFVTCFTLPVSGQVQTRVIPCDEVADIISNPQDASEPWFYLRRWYDNQLDYATGRVLPQMQECYYPAIGYRPTGKNRPTRINNWPVRWDAPVIHVAVNRPLGWKFGIPDAYAAIDWARAYRDFLEDWAKVVKALSRFAFKATTPGSKAAQVRAAIAASPSVNRRTGETNEAGATAVISPDVALEAIGKSGATIDSESGKPIAAMVAAGLGMPVTMLLADPGQTGARAVAETLDRPTQNEVGQRRDVWTQFTLQLLGYVITESVRAPKGVLKGQVRKDPVSGREYVTLNGGTSDGLDIVWPNLKDTPVDLLVDAIQKANSTGTVPPEVIVRLLLSALGVRNADEIIEKLIDEDGQFIWPAAPPIAAGSQLALMARNGQDPAQAGTGPMADDTEPPVPADDVGDGEQPGDKAPVDKSKAGDGG